MNINKADFEKAKDNFFPAKNGFDGAKKALTEYAEPQINLAMHHFSVTLKYMLKIVCVKYNIAYSEYDNLALLFAKTRRFLAGDILASDILNMETEVLSWQYYTNTSIKTADEANEVGKIFEYFFNNVIRKFLSETKKSLEWQEDEFSGSGIF